MTFSPPPRCSSAPRSTPPGSRCSRACAWWLGGPRAALLTALLLPILALLSLFAIERESAVIDAVRAWLRLRRAAGETRERLRRRRSDLADLLDDVNEWLERERAGTS